MKKLIILLTAVAGLSITGCKKGFLDINNNPNEAVESNMTPNLILPNALNRTAGRIANQYGWLNHYVGYWAPSGSFSSNTQETTYNLTTGFQAAQWTGIYDNLYDYHFMQLKAEALGQDFYAGVAKIMKSLLFQRLVDMYGNVPYSKAFDLVGNIKPAYDQAATIYADLLVQITDGINLIKNADINENPKIATADIMFAGNANLWAKFGNTLKLRILIHQSQMAGFNPAAAITTIQNEGSGFLGTGQSADVNPGYLSDKPADFWASYMYNVTGTGTVNTFERAQEFVLNEFRTQFDPRIAYFFKPVTSTAFPPGTFRGVLYGLPPQTSNSEDRLSNIGGAPTASGPAVGLGKAFNMRAWILTSVESMFLQAEAIQRGWIAGDPKTSYENAVRESFRWLAIPNADASFAAYMAANVGNPKVDWNAATNKIALIIWQKYYALTGIDPLETWTDKRRLNIIPIPLSVAPGTTATTIPIRLQYPQAEYDYNTENVVAQGTINHFTTKIFWMP
jgi:hypothetical protein